VPGVRALLLTTWGSTPELADAPEPEAPPGHTLVHVRAVALNPADLAVAAGRFYLPLPEPPFIPGAEAVGEVVSSAVHRSGTRVWCLSMVGSLAELVVAPDDRVVPVPDGLSDELAVAVGVAGLAGWMPVRDRGALAAGETVVVLAASGIVGQVAIQAARGIADRIVAVARSAEGRDRALELGADMALAIGPDLAGALRDACGDGADLVIDPLWGDPAVAAIGALRRGGRLVQVGNAHGPTADITAGPLRGGRLDIRGFSVFSEDPADRARAYSAVAEAALVGDVKLSLAVAPLDEGPAAWERQAGGTGGVKLVLRV
jgi:NADPH:quinone reductase-like Zn-dependent oxidoreductase